MVIITSTPISKEECSELRSGVEIEKPLACIKLDSPKEHLDSVIILWTLQK